MVWHFCENPSILGEIVSPWKASSHALKRFAKCEKETCGSEASLCVVTGNFCCPTASSCGHWLFLVPELLLPSTTWCWAGCAFPTAAQKVEKGSSYVCFVMLVWWFPPQSQESVVPRERCTEGTPRTAWRGGEMVLQLAPSQVNSVGCGQEGLTAF